LTDREPKYAVHAEPVWRDRADYIVNAELDGGLAGWREQLWGRQVSPREVQLCCLPFFAYDLALGDVVAVDDDNLVRSVVRRSGRYVFRVNIDDPTQRRRATEAVRATNVLQEWYSTDYAALDAPNLQRAEQLAAHLQDLQDAGHLQFETGRQQP
jgi:hypothetical protein